MRRMRQACPLESQEQRTVVEWAAWNEARWPQLRNLFAIPNGGSRHTLEAVNLKRQGVKKGVPDMCLAWPSGRFHGLYIEMKRERGSTIEPEQREWAERLIAAGYAHFFAKGSSEAIAVLEGYLATALPWPEVAA